MNQMRIGLREERKNYLPGDELIGGAGWELAAPPKAVEVRLLWFTRGKGTEDVVIVHTERFENPQAAEARPFKFLLPAEPYSFSGKLISLIWAVEVVALPSKESARTEFVMAPGGQEVVLPKSAQLFPPQSGVRARDNPFSTDRVLRVRYRLQGSTWDELLTCLARLRYRVAIVGPDGTGKTTLLEDLEPRLAALGFTPKPLRLDEDHPRFPAGFERALSAQLGSRDIVLLDGAEQLSRWRWWRFRRATAKAGGLVVTSHRPGLLPTLLEARTTPELLNEIVTELAGAEAAALQAETQRLFGQHRGNLRAALRELYDLFAARS